MRRALVALSVTAVLATLVPAAATGSPASPAGPSDGALATDIRELPPDYKLPRTERAPAAVRRAAASFDPRRAPEIGDTKLFLAIDDYTQETYVKEFTYRGVGRHIEVWVASDSDEVSTGTDFPEGDCRNGERTEITDRQVEYLIEEFDSNIYPKESALFSVPPDRNGARAFLAEFLELPPGYYRGDGDNIVTLVDNVRDDQFYDTDNSEGLSYIAGFFSSGLNELLNRNVMTIDAYDWLHRTRQNPPNEPVPGDLCASAPARPSLYEGVFAHEYQHLLEYYEDPDERSWVNEGLSDYAALYTGYVDPAAAVSDIHLDSHTQCFLGWLGEQTQANPNPREGGPENSLTLWGDQTDYESEILCDYGAAFTFMLMLRERYGPRFLGDLHRANPEGFGGLKAVLDRHAPRMTAKRLVNLWAASVVVDGLLDDRASFDGPRDRSDYRVGTLDATINWDTDQTHSSPGAPPNGSDYVRLTDGTWLRASEVRRLRFDGSRRLPPLPLEWTVDLTPPGSKGDPALYSGAGDNLDRAIVRQIQVPEGDADLTFEAMWDTEAGYDYAYVQVSANGGRSYVSIPCTDSIPAPLGPGFEGESDGFVSQTCDLSRWAGQAVVLAFRYVTDSGVQEDGFWVDDVMVGQTLVSDGSTLDGWQSLTEFNPIEVEDYTVRIVSYDRHRTVVQIANLPLGRGFHGILTRRELAPRIANGAGIVAVVVTYHDPTESVNQYARYELRANGLVMPGG
jgi:hypothetical protein